MSKPSSQHTMPPISGSRRIQPWRGLSAKVLLLTALFVMIGEVLIFVPSVANFRLGWFKNQIAIAEMAALAIEAAPDRQVSDELRDELLKGAGVNAVALQRDGSRHLMLRNNDDHMVAETYDLRMINWHQSITQAIAVLLTTENRIISVIGEPPNMSGSKIELALSEQPLRKAMLVYSGNILKLSVVLSLLSGFLVFLALNYVLVRPMRRFSAAMLHFAENPEDPNRIMSPSDRSDEIGLAEREMAQMQNRLVGTLHQKNRLVQLGLAVSKISHDLRNMLAAAQIVSDRLAMIEDPAVQKFTPKLMASLDRAIGYCAQTLKFGRAEDARPQRVVFPLKPFLDEVIESEKTSAAGTVSFANDSDTDIMVDADRDHLFRIIGNLVRNAVEAVQAGEAGTIIMRGWREDAVVMIEVRDNGPGVSAKAREHLFEAFRGSARAGGTGLGLSIANELASAHGGGVKLLDEAGSGAVFQVTIPDRDADKAAADCQF